MTYLGAPDPKRRQGDVVITVAVLLIAAVAAALPDGQQSRIEAGVRATLLYPFLELHRSSAERTSVGRRAAALRLERDSLVEVVTRIRALAGQAGQLASLSTLSGPELGDVRPVEIYPGRPRVGDPHVFVLRGEGLASLEFPVGIFTGSGVVGVARAAHGGGARGEFWSHPDFRVSVITEDGVVTGIVRAATPIGEQPIMLLEGAPFQSDIEPGTVLMTTGISGVYPPGIAVGTVRELAEAEAGWMKSYHVEPAAIPSRTGVALIWDRPPLEELFPLVRDGFDPRDSLPTAEDSLPASSDRVPASADGPGAGDPTAPADSLGGPAGSRLAPDDGPGGSAPA